MNHLRKKTKQEDSNYPPAFILQFPGILSCHNKALWFCTFCSICLDCLLYFIGLENCYFSPSWGTSFTILWGLKWSPKPPSRVPYIYFSHTMYHLASGSLSWFLRLSFELPNLFIFQIFTCYAIKCYVLYWVSAAKEFILFWKIQIRKVGSHKRWLNAMLEQGIWGLADTWKKYLN